MRKMTNKEIIREMLADELSKDSRFDGMTLESALADIKANKRWLGDKAYVLYVAYRRGLSGLRDYENVFKSKMEGLMDSALKYKELCNAARDIHFDVKTKAMEINGEIEPLPF